MERRAFGKTGMSVSVLGFGGSEIGFHDVPQVEVDSMLNQALDDGLNVIDTAECYADSEGKIGRAVAHRRDEFHLFTKCGHASGFDEPDWDPKMLAKSIDRSLERLRTDRVDLIQLHSCREELLRRGEVIEVLQRAKEAGKTRFIGYSGDSHAALYAIETGVFDSLQTSVNIADQEAIDLTLPRALEAGMGVVVKRPVANVAWQREPDPESYPRPYWERLQELDYEFLHNDLSDSVETALRFTLSQPGVCTAIVGTTRPGRWQENAAMIAKGMLPQVQIDAIRDRWKKIAPPEWKGRT